MARVSRSKRQPAFDPSELNDLIFSPAVGTGVGSHLVATPDAAPLMEAVELQQSRNVATVVTFDSIPGRVTREIEGSLNAAATVDTSSQNLGSRRSLPLLVTDSIDLSAVAPSNLSTVATSHPSTVDKSSESAPAEPFKSNLSTVDTFTNVQPEARPAITESHDLLGLPAEDVRQPVVSKKQRYWVTDNGDLVPHGRVKRIRLAQDVLNPAEESVYDALWNTRAPLSEDREPFRIVQAGYDYLGKRTRLSKKTIQRIIAKLINKNFIAVEEPADIYQRSSTVYRVYGYKEVLERHMKQGRSYVAKIGPGFSYVRPFNDTLVDLATVDIGDLSTVVNCDMSTVVNMSTVTVDSLDLSTVVNLTTTHIGIHDLGSKSSSSAIHEALASYGAVDDELVNKLIRSCQDQVPDCSADEIAHFIAEKGALIRVSGGRIYNPIGFLLTAVPKCFCGEAFQFYRAEVEKRGKAEATREALKLAELDEWRREQEARLEDTDVPEEEKLFIREFFGKT